MILDLAVKRMVQFLSSPLPNLECYVQYDTGTYGFLSNPSSRYHPLRTATKNVGSVVPLADLIITQRATKAHNISRTATNLNTFNMLMQINAGRNFQGNFDFWHSKDPDFHNDLRPATEVSRLCG